MNGLTCHRIYVKHFSHTSRIRYWWLIW